MAKNLQTSVKLDTKGAVKSLDSLEKKINRINNLVNKTNSRNSGLTKAINNASKATSNLEKNVKRVNSANNQAANSANKMTKSYQNSSRAASVLTKNLRTLISTYVGLMGVQAVLNASDTLTSARNKLNYTNGGDEALTREAMDKTYAAAQRSRGGYTDMLSNVAKTMTLAPDAFQGNVDNAIRFQEIMSKAYTVGGASAAEQASSMYQLVQALGSGILQGDELRSVREGAPIAYKEIEKFAQGVYKTEESLKELASQGKITSDIVVAAMMEAGEGIDKAFADTDMTFAQAFTQIKNMAIQAFDPVLKTLNEALNSDDGKAAIEGIGQALVGLANATMFLFDIFGRFFSWCSDNWYWLQWVVYSVVVAMITHLMLLAAKAVIAFFTAMSPLSLWIVAIGLVIAALAVLANNCANVCDFIYQISMMLAYAIIGLLTVVLAVYIVTGAIMISIPMLIGLAIVGMLLVALAAFVKFTTQIVGGAYGIWEVFKTACQNIGIFFSNLWNAATGDFWGFIGDVLSGLADLEPAFNALAQLFGLEGVTLSGLTQSAYDREAEANGKIQNLESFGDAWDRGYSTGAAKGQAIQDAINGWGDSFKGLFDNSNSLTDPGSYLPSAYDPIYGVGGGYDPAKALGSLDNIDGNTGKMADSMELTQEDLEYLRRVADMEWKKEYTTASIVVDMTNNNQINGESDLDGIVTRLADKLYEEMNVVANGVYAY